MTKTREVAKPKAAPRLEKTGDAVRALAQDMIGAAKGFDNGKRAEFYREKFKKKSLIELAYAMDSAQRAKDWIDLLANYANAQFDALRLELVPETMEEDSVENITYDEIGRLSLTGDMYVSLPAEKKVAFYKWLKKNKLGSLITETVNSSTLRAFVKERVSKGKEVPRKLLNVTPYTRASITKA